MSSKSEASVQELDVPVIDARGLLTGLHWPRPEVVQQIKRACEHWGFFQLDCYAEIDCLKLLIGKRRLPESVIRAQFDASAGFFALPLEQKATCRRTADNPLGFFNDELTKQRLDLKEGFDFGHKQNPNVQGNIQAFNRWPEAADPGFKPAMLRYFRTMEHFGLRLTEAFLAAFNMPTHSLHPWLEGTHSAFCRLNYYPPATSYQLSASSADVSAPGAEASAAQPPPANGAPSSPPASVSQQEVDSSRGQAWHEQGKDLGISPHSDAGFLTVLAQGEVPGLQVWHGQRWHTVQPIPGAFVINVGDMAQVLTNGQYKAPLHRVLASGPKARYSIAFFFQPSFKLDAAPLPSCIDDAHPPMYRPVNWGNFRSRRYAGDFADVGKEIQIEDYLIA